MTGCWICIVICCDIFCDFMLRFTCGRDSWVNVIMYITQLFLFRIQEAFNICQS